MGTLINLVPVRVYPDPHVNSDQFWNMIAGDFIESQGEFNRDYLADHLDRLIHLLSPYEHENADILSQLFGIYRIWGHPTVDGMSGINKLKELVRHTHAINLNSVAIIKRKWREYFSMSYYQQEGRWPAFKPDSLQADSFLCRTLREGYPLDLLNPDYHEEQWDEIQFDQTFTVPDKFELSEMISDNFRFSHHPP